MTKHADRIWRTVVFAGAMLGAPLVSADTPKDAKPGKPAPPPAPAKEVKPTPPDTVDSVTKQIAEVDKKIKLTTEAITNAQNDADRKAAQAKLEAHKKDKVELEKKLTALKIGKVPAPTTPVAKLEKELADVNAKIDTAITAVTDAQTDADRKAAKAKLASFQKEKADVEKKLATEKQKAAAAARPRTNESDKPIGRGFVLA
jgi:hypothetical protein